MKKTILLSIIIAVGLSGCATNANRLDVAASRGLETGVTAGVASGVANSIGGTITRFFLF